MTIASRAMRFSRRPPLGRDVLSASTSTSRRDIEGRADVELLVARFHQRVFADELLAPLYLDLARHETAWHTADAVEFWSALLLHDCPPGTGVFAPHASMNARAHVCAHHFARWVDTWCATVDELFVGELAREAKQLSGAIRDTWHGALPSGRHARGVEPPSCIYRYAQADEGSTDGS